MKRLAAGILALTLIVVHAQLARAARQAGVAEECVRAKVSMEGDRRTLAAGMPVHLGEVVETGEGGYARLRLLDNSEFTLGPDSSVVIDEFVYGTEQGGGKMIARAVRGLFRYVTGKIATEQPNSLEVRLPAGTIGVRGTTIGGEIIGMRTLVMLLKSESPFFPRAHVGHVIVRNRAGDHFRETHLQNTDYGTVIEGEGQAPGPAFRVEGEKINDFIERLNSGRDPGASLAPPAESAFDEYVAVQNSVLGTTSYRIKPEEAKKEEPPAAEDAGEETRAATVRVEVQ
jgi:hypothetical protein